MNISSVVNQGLIGMQRSQGEMARSAQQIAEAGTTQRDNPQVSNDGGDLAEPIVNMQMQKHLFDASARVVQVGSDTIGTLLNMKA